MGFLSFWKKVISGESEEDAEEAELDAARARHGITVNKAEMNKRFTEEQRFAEEYDVWEDLKDYRMNFLFGGWLTKRFRVFGEDKVKKQLDDLDRKRKEKEEQKKLKGEG